MIAGLILAAGRSTRFGSPKQIAQLAGKPLLQHAIDTIAGCGVDEIIVVLGYNADEIGRCCSLPDRARIVVNPHFDRGLSASLGAGLRATDIRSEIAVILLGDEPLMPARAIERVLETARTSAGRAVHASWNGVSGHPVALPRNLWHDAQRITGDEGARSLLGASNVLEVEMNEPRPIDIDDRSTLATLEPQFEAFA